MAKRTPSAQIVAGGRPFPFFDMTVTQTRTKKGDTFKACSALSLVDLSFWMTTNPPVPVTITINGTKIFDGNVDVAEASFDGRTFEISGRDKCAPLNESQSSEKFPNQKPQDIVTTIAKRHGLEVEADAPTLNAGKIYSSDFDAISNRGSEWTIINRLADHYGMVAYMTGGKLFFKNFDEQLPVYQIRYTPPTPQSYEDGNFITLKATRNFVLGRPVKVNVHSHNHHKKQVISASMTSAAGQGTPLVYNHTIAGINQDQAQTIAKAKLAEIQSHEITISGLEFPGDETVTARMQFEVSGTNSPIDQKYDAQQIEHRISVKDGFRTGIKIKNKKKGS